jgi:hypothetical protein
MNVKFPVEVRIDGNPKKRRGTSFGDRFIENFDVHINRVIFTKVQISTFVKVKIKFVDIDPLFKFRRYCN